MLTIILFFGLVAICAQPFWVVVSSISFKSVRKPIFFLEIITFLFASLQIFFGFFVPDSRPLCAEIIGVALFLFGTTLLMYARYILWRSHAYLPAMVCGVPNTLVTRGPYRYIQHPVYCGLLFACLGFEIALFSPLIAGVAVVALFLVSQIRKEESLLFRTFGGQWIEFKKQTPFRVFPFVW
ncbi:MAG: Isoprenylcysteine carboxyl methyltransferase [Parcubacteria group bacterium Gr01-1014_29]|nr:MAG: Isoprenylcysteine carboxyl methyltransferase [Parcubacteria group bacterium Gr01-1014_29]